MFDSVRKAFPSFITPFEGRVEYMYLDQKGLVTTGIGNLIDPVDLAKGLPFVHKTDGAAATEAEIEADWNAVKARTDLIPAPDRLDQFRDLTNLRLTNDSIDNLVKNKLDSNEAFLKRTPEFADLDSWPADAQLGLFSMAWAMGAGFGTRPGPDGFPMFRKACADKDWDSAATQSRIRDAAQKRNDADHTLFSNAAQVVQQDLDPSALQWPNVL